jgi:hypothetical protein
MALTAANLASLAFTDHVVNFPDAAAVVVQHATLGAFNPSQEMLNALCGGIVNALSKTAINARCTGSGGGGSAPTIDFVLSEAILQTAVLTFVANNEWTGEYAALAADSLVGAPIRRLMSVGLLQMNDANFIGTADVDPAANLSIANTLEVALNRELPASFIASQYFGDPLNDQIISQIGYYAAAYATAIASITASPVFSGDTGGDDVEDLIVPGFIV